MSAIIEALPERTRTLDAGTPHIKLMQPQDAARWDAFVLGAKDGEFDL